MLDLLSHSKNVSVHTITAILTFHEVIMAHFFKWGDFIKMYDKTIKYNMLNRIYLFGTMLVNKKVELMKLNLTNKQKEDLQ